MTQRLTTTLLTGALVALGGAALAADADHCETVRLSDPGWTDIASTNGMAAAVLTGLGYTAEVSSLSVPIAFESLKTGDIDVFLGNWMPAQTGFREDVDASGATVVLAENLPDAKFTLAVTQPGADLGVADFADLDAFLENFEGKIYGIEPGAPANQSIAGMIEADKFGLGDWELVESSEQAMLAQVARNTEAGIPSVFLAWAPHPMNVAMPITYLSGGDAEFGPNYGGATVHTVANKEWAEACPNLARLFSQMAFSLDAENAIMGEILDNGATGADAGAAWLAANPDVLGPWLDGVTTFDGAPGLEAVLASLG